MLKKWLVPALKFSFAGGLIYFMVSRGYLNFSLLKPLLQPQWAIPLLAITTLAIFLQCLRWQLLLDASSLRLPIKQIFPFYLIGLFFNFALPGAVGGDVVKAFYVAKDFPEKKFRAITSVAVDRLLGLYAMLWMAVVALVLNPKIVVENKEVFWLTLICISALGLMNLLALLAFSKKFEQWSLLKSVYRRIPLGLALEQVHQALHDYREHKIVLLKATIYGFLGQLCFIGFMISVGYAIGQSHLPLGVYFFAVPIGFVIQSIPLSPGGIGVGQVAFSILFQLYLGDSENKVGQTAITAAQIAQVILGLVGAYFYIARGLKRPDQSIDPSPELVR